MATAGLLTCILPASHSMLTIKRCKTHGKRSSRKNVSDHDAYRNKTLTAAGLSGLLTRFPFNHYAHIPMGVFYPKTSSLLRRCDVAVNQLRVQSYDKKMNFRITSCRFYLVICDFLPIFAKNYNINPFRNHKYTLIYIWQQLTTRRSSFRWWAYPRLSHKTRNRF